jgi:restriction system protein
MVELFDEQGGFRTCHSFTLVTIIQVETVRFCRRFLTQELRESKTKVHDPGGRQYDRMIEAARCGRQNIIKAGTSRDAEVKLMDKAFASLSELRGDYEILLLDRGQIPWSMHAADARSLNAVTPDAATFEDDAIHESARQVFGLRKKYAKWLDADDATVVANAMLLIIGRALSMLKSRAGTRSQAFEGTDGAGERLPGKRVAAREKSGPPAPECPKCGKPMRRRKSAKGEFWGCSGFPECKGTRAIRQEAVDRPSPRGSGRQRLNGWTGQKT